MIAHGSLILVLLFTSPLMEAFSQPTKVVTLVMFKWEIKEEARLLERRMLYLHETLDVR
uniref:Uncharacterized protein n=1 Tax=Brassica oleracea var. oleracea TaxID=109376 RepID=A0A0D2ZRW6_BRAOL